jgi:hypothetical protein
MWIWFYNNLGSAGVIQVTEGGIDVRQVKIAWGICHWASLTTLFFKKLLFFKGKLVFFKKMIIVWKNRVDKLALQRKENNSPFERKPQYTCVVENWWRRWGYNKGI